MVIDPARDVDGAERDSVDGEPVRPAEHARRVRGQQAAPAWCRPRATRSAARRSCRSSRRRSALYPVGRLDIDTTGLILLTNDGELAHRLTHPRFEVAKTYRVTVANAPVGRHALRGAAPRASCSTTARPRLPGSAGSRPTARAHDPRGAQAPGQAHVRGRRSPRALAGRVRFGPLELGDLRPGEHRELSADEIAALRLAGAGDVCGRVADVAQAGCRAPSAPNRTQAPPAVGGSWLARMSGREANIQTMFAGRQDRGRP